MHDQNDHKCNPFASTVNLTTTNAKNFENHTKTHKEPSPCRHYGKENNKNINKVCFSLSVFFGN